MEEVFKLPDLGEGIHEGEILEVKVAAGDDIKEGDIIFIIETDKAAVEIPSPFTGKVSRVSIQKGDLIQVGTELIAVSIDTVSPKVAPPTPPPKKTAKVKTPASPSTRRLARELGVNLSAVPASGKGGLVTADDVRNFAKDTGAKESSPAPSTVEHIPEDTAHTQEIEEIPLRSIRRAIAKKMALSWAQIPHVSHLDEVDITDLEALRSDHKEGVSQRGGRLTLTIFALKAAVAALVKFPKFNAAIDMEREIISLKKFYNIGVAVDTDRGLVAPVLKGVDQKSIMELAVELPALAKKAQDGELAQSDLSGGTFTITNIGAIGGRGFQPIINFPEVAILGLGRAQWRPRVNAAREIEPRLILPMVVAFDHRVIDGAEAARFVNMVRDTLENPASMLFQ